MNGLKIRPIAPLNFPAKTSPQHVVQACKAKRDLRVAIQTHDIALLEKTLGTRWAGFSAAQLSLATLSNGWSPAQFAIRCCKHEWPLATRDAILEKVLGLILMAYRQACPRWVHTTIYHHLPTSPLMTLPAANMKTPLQVANSWLWHPHGKRLAGLCQQIAQQEAADIQNKHSEIDQ